MKLLFAIAFLSAQCVFAATETKEFNAATVKTIEIHNMSGSIKVVGEVRNSVLVTTEKVKFGEKCTLDLRQEATKVIIKVDRKNGFFNTDNCDVNINVSTPQAVALEVKNGSGPIDVQNTKGEIEYNVGSGTVKIDAQIEKLDGKSGSGSTEVKGLLADTKLKTGSGNIKLTYITAPTKGALDIKSGSGNVEVWMPSDAKIITNVTRGIGKTFNELGDTQNAPYKISLKAGSGDLTIKKIQ